ncbi:Rho-GTPase-activating protein 8 [Elsinoe australis]|uniref:Rho-GTPase-activating protein 8 n=1 Tax=Elsinoe australis TaxID=40998 RepID=A0A2P7Z644_9PEZI|nr:Rho-GTPase-activating protein 8 [Elsinoe australis]
MSSFANSFWGGGDYAAGLGVLFQKLNQGLAENQQILTVARMRAEAEELYSQRLGEIDYATNRIQNGFQRDDGASVKKAFEGVRTEMGEASKSHQKIASNIRELVVTPFSRWCDQHAARVQNSQDDLQNRVKAHDKQAEVVRSCRSQYYNKCRRVEDLDEEEKLAFQDPQSELKSPKSATAPTVKVSEPDAEEEDEPIDLGDETYSPERLKKVLAHALENIKLGESKVPILGTYQNVSTGADITEYIQKHLNGTSVSYAERIGQDLVSNGFLRLVGNVGSTFANSSRMHYQWRPKAFKMANVPEQKQPLGRTSTMSSAGSIYENPSAVGEYLQGWNPLVNQHPNETPAERLRREARESDEKYKAAVKKLDSLRCNLEEAMIDHMKFMERCELDRLKAVKSVILDMSGCLSNVIPSLQSTVDKMMLFQETIQPQADLRYLLENYRTGSFVPRVQIYENYYNQIGDQIFGVDIEARARADRKRVPIIVTTLLTYLDNKYPELEGDEARRGIWLVDVPLGATHHLRNAVVTAQGVPFEMLERYDVPIVASLLKLYLLELPDSIVSSQIYEIVKTIYTTTAQSTDEATRISVIQSTLGQLRLANIATLDAITTHFTRLIELTSGDENYVASLATTLAPCILRPKHENSLTVTEKYNMRLIRDLFKHKDAIFGELKRAASLSSAQAKAQEARQRYEQKDESNRREAMEERQRAIQANAERTRAPSPNPMSRISMPLSVGHRRERSTSAETRFPIAPASASNSPSTSRSRGDSLKVPTSPPNAPVGAAVSHDRPQVNGHSTNQGPLPPPKDEVSPLNTQHNDTAKPTSRERSSTVNTNHSEASPIHLSSTLTNPSDWASPSAYYSYSQDDSAPPSQRTSVAQSEADSQPSTQASSHPPRHGSTASISAREAVQKRDSLTRGGGVGGRSGSNGPGNFSRRTMSSGLQRQSLVSKRESVDSMSGVQGVLEEYTQSPVEQQGAGAAEEDRGRRGVELVDKPMDD